MTIRTHKMIADANESDTGKIVDVTHAGAGLAGVSPACKMFFPMTETTGATTVTDPVPATDVVITPSGSIAFGETNAVTLLHTGATGAGTLPTIGAVSTLLVGVFTPTANGTFLQYGAAGADNFGLTLTSGITGLDAGFSKAISAQYPNDMDLVIGEQYAIGVLIDGSSLYANVDGVWGAAYTLDPAFVPFNSNDSMGFGSGADVVHCYGVALFQFATNPSMSEIGEKILEMKTDWIAGTKRIPIDWLTEEAG